MAADSASGPMAAGAASAASGKDDEDGDDACGSVRPDGSGPDGSLASGIGPDTTSGSGVGASRMGTSPEGSSSLAPRPGGRGRPRGGSVPAGIEPARRPTDSAAGGGGGRIAVPERVRFGGGGILIGLDPVGVPGPPTRPAGVDEGSAGTFVIDGPPSRAERSWS